MAEDVNITGTIAPPVVGPSGEPLERSDVPPKDVDKTQLTAGGEFADAASAILAQDKPVVPTEKVVQPKPVETSALATEKTTTDQQMLGDIEAQLAVIAEQTAKVQAEADKKLGEKKEEPTEDKDEIDDTLLKPPVGGEQDDVDLGDGTGISEEESLSLSGVLTPDAQKYLDDNNAAIDAETEELKALLDAKAKALEAASQNAINSIKISYDKRKRDQQKINEDIIKIQTILGARSGRQRFAPEIQNSIITAEESAAVERLADLDAEETRLIAEARAASELEQLGVLSERIDLLRETRQEKNKLLMDMLDMSVKMESIRSNDASELRENLKFQQETQRFIREEQQFRSETVAPVILPLLTGDPDADSALIEQFAIAHDVSPATLTSSILGLQESGLTFEIKEADGRLTRFGFDEVGNMVSKVDLGKATSGAGSGSRSVFKETENGIEQIVLDADQNILERNIIGMSGTNARKVREAVANFASADALLSTVEDMANLVITAENPINIPRQYIQGNIEAITKYDPNATVFLSSVEAFSSMLTRAAGEKGVLTTQDVQRIINALPKLTDTKASSQLKIQVLRSLYESIKTGAIEAYTNPIPGQPGVPGGQLGEGDTGDADISDIDFNF